MRETDSSDSKEVKLRGIPEEFQPREYGGRLIKPVRLGDICMLAQSRDKHNPALANIESSIESRGVLQSPIVGRMSAEGFQEYVEFVNRIWGTNEQFANFSPSDDGTYYLVIAGHTRLRAVTNIEQRRADKAAQLGYDISSKDIAVHCCIYDDPDPETIISIQLDENLHEKVPEERTALAIVEAYYLGIEQKKWANQDEFREAVNGKFTSRQLQRALAFSRLDEDFRKIVFAKGIPYVLGTEVAETADHFMAFTLQKYHYGAAYDELPVETQRELDKYRTDWIGAEISYLMGQGRRVNITAYRTKIEGYKQDWVIAGGAEETNGFQELAMFEMADPMADWQNERLQMFNNYRSAVADLSRLTSETAAVSLAAHLSVMERNGHVGDAVDLLAEVEERSRDFAKTVGQHATLAANNRLGQHEADITEQLFAS